MPRGDGTGPMGMGSMSGRSAGFCAGYAVPGFMNGFRGRGGMGRGHGGRGFGMGMGKRNGRNAPMLAAQPISYPQVDELSALKNQAKNLGEALQSITSRISELEADKK